MIPRPLSLAHDFLRKVLTDGDIAVDATLGNGYDAVFLAEQVGESGRVIGFDIQEGAVEESRRRLTDKGLMNRCTLHACGHEKIASYVEEGVAAVVFNLGYLPGGDKELVTATETTLSALTQAASLLRPKGVLTVMCYVGHPGGEEEGDSVVKWMAGLPRESWRVFRYQSVNAPNHPPFLLIAEKQ